ncbi:unnamed protein product [Linum trigynum]|uniref:Uncharacterized protein n=1 Tax=Linum trigynum TaxID=586398 RepID=A0AAV2FAX0_9ROSI
MEVEMALGVGFILKVRAGVARVTPGGMAEGSQAMITPSTSSRRGEELGVVFGHKGATRNREAGVKHQLKSGTGRPQSRQTNEPGLQLAVGDAKLKGKEVF